MPLTYATVPTASRFQKDSSVTFAIRSKDEILKRIDWMLEAYDKATHISDYSKRRLALCDLYQTCKYWIKSHKEGNSRMLDKRAPAVTALFDAVVKQLGVLCQCSPGEVDQMIDEIFGRDLHKWGVKVDEALGKAQYLSEVERQIYRIRFKGGLAYQYPWWLQNAPQHLVLAESSRAYTKIIRKGIDGERSEGSPDFGGFAMTMERELFMAKHSVGHESAYDGLFHSSYTAGQSVIMSGTMLIKQGTIRAVRADSGHYQPTDMNMVGFLWALRMFAVNLGKVDLLTFDAQPLGTALEFLRSHLSWDQYRLQRENELVNRFKADKKRGKIGLPPRHPHLQPQGTAPQPRTAATQSADAGGDDNYNSGSNYN